MPETETTMPDIAVMPSEDTGSARQELKAVLQQLVETNARFVERGRQSPLIPSNADTLLEGLAAAGSALVERATAQIDAAPEDLANEWMGQLRSLSIPQMLSGADELISQVPTGAIYLNLNPVRPTLLDCIKDTLKCVVNALPFIPALVKDILCCIYEAVCCFSRL